MAAVLLPACSRTPAPLPDAALAAMDWPQIEAAARGRTVTFVMWTGDPAINAYIDDFLRPRLLRLHDIRLRVVPGQADIANQVIAERDAGRRSSSLDLLWINGETFFKLRQLQSLHGPFTERLPNNRHVRWSDPTIARDFQQAVDGYEMPWGNVQLLLIVDRDKVSSPPDTPAALADWIHAHPGRFSFDSGFTGLSFLKSLMHAFAASPEMLEGPFDEARYLRLREPVFAWLREVRADLWRQGRTFPRDVAQLHQLFAAGELDFTMSFNDGEVDNKIALGQFPASAEGYALRTGMLRNSHYLGIPATSRERAAAMVVINELLSPEAQFEKLRPSVWGDGTVLDIERLPEPWPARFAAAAERRRVPSRAALAAIARPEPSPELMIRLEQDFRRAFVER